MSAVAEVENKKTDAAPKPGKKRRTKSPLPKRLYDLEEMAPYLGQKDHWGVRNLINHHGLPVVRYGTAMRLDKDAVDKWIEAHKEVVTF